MTERYLRWLAVTLLLASAGAQADWNPRPNWQDSYAVGGVCYCNSRDFDHNLDRKSADTPAGRLKVTQICADIEAVVGAGPRAGRVPYNDIQCGNGPLNDAPDEAGCPGRVDQGPSGCDRIGPKWPLVAIYGPWPDGSTEPPEPTEGSDVTVSASRNPGDADKAIDGDRSTRWTTQERQRPGQVFLLDLGSPRTVGRLVLDAGGSPDDTPAEYSVSTSSDGRSYDVVAAGSGGRGSTTMEFANHTARYVRITQTGSRERLWWSIHELTVSARLETPVSPSDGQALDRSAWTLIAADQSGSVGDAIDGRGDSRWTTRRSQRTGQWLELDLARNESFSRVVLDTSGSEHDYPRRYTVRVSDDGERWRAVAAGGGETVTDIGFVTQRARYVRIEQSGSDDFYWWSIHELNVYR